MFAALRTVANQEDKQMVQQVEFRLPAMPRGYHLITNAVLQQLPELPRQGLLSLFIKHTSAGLTINENADQLLISQNCKIIHGRVKQFFNGMRQGKNKSQQRKDNIEFVAIHSKLLFPFTTKGLPLKPHSALGFDDNP